VSHYGALPFRLKSIFKAKNKKNKNKIIKKNIMETQIFHHAKI
jgi:hypothetical protein